MSAPRRSPAVDGAAFDAGHRDMQRRTLVTALILVSLLASQPAGAADPEFRVYVPEPTLAPGGEAELTVQLTNDPDDPDERAEPAENVRATVESGDAPIDVTSGTRLLGSTADGQVQEVTVRVDVPSTIEPGSYELPIDVEYEHDGDEESERVYASVEVEDRAQFAVDGAETTAPVGGGGTSTVTITNVGTEAASNASTTVTSTDPDVQFGGSESATQYAGEWEPGESRTFEYRTTVANGADARDHTVESVVEYDDEGGTERTSRTLSFGLTPLGEQTFAVENVDSALRVGQEGTLGGEIVNTGETTASNAVVVLESSNPNVEVLESEYAVGELGPGDRADVAFDTEVTDSAEAGPRQLSMRVEYRDEDDDERESDPIDVRADVGPKESEFDVEPVNATFEAGEDGTLELNVTNNRDETLREISAKLFEEAPISASDDEAFVPELEPGESATLRFEVGVEGDVLAKTYPLKLDFQYDDEEGETLISDTYQVPIAVTDEGGSGLPLGIAVGIVAFVALGAVGYVYSRR
ncbi:COG1361 S-layer family protein [Halegenticoccus tardaugens]|uniref:COG1361 S-layer family protein n=1 Tax=Halegenticoccus tardaugens TaxID=2071624 RepID=UPI00100A3504|nr:COG1361 S-layer family protein [Halegenticoccus tardaugens]